MRFTLSSTVLNSRLQTLAKVINRKTCLNAIENNRCLTHVFQCAVNPFGAVLSRHGISHKWYLEKREPLGVGFLPYVRRYGRDVKTFDICMYLHLLKEIFIFWNVF